MPNYGVAQAGSNPATPSVTAGQGVAGQPGGFNLTVVNPGDAFVLFNAESPTSPQASVAFARGVGPTLLPAGMVFTVVYQSAPTATIEFQGSNDDVDANYQKLYDSVNKQTDSYADIGEYAFYRAKLISGTIPAGGVTVKVQR